MHDDVKTKREKPAIWAFWVEGYSGETETTPATYILVGQGLNGERREMLSHTDWDKLWDIAWDIALNLADKDEVRVEMVRGPEWVTTDHGRVISFVVHDE